MLLTFLAPCYILGMYATPKAHAQDGTIAGGIRAREIAGDPTARAERCTDWADLFSNEARRRDAGVPRERALEIAKATATFAGGVGLRGVPLRTMLKEINLVYDHPQMTPAETAKRAFDACQAGALPGVK